MNITVTKNPNPGKLPPADQLGFGSVFTDQSMAFTRIKINADILQRFYARKFFGNIFYL